MGDAGSETVQDRDGHRRSEWMRRLRLMCEEMWLNGRLQRNEGTKETEWERRGDGEWGRACAIGGAGNECGWFGNG